MATKDSGSLRTDRFVWVQDFAARARTGDRALIGVIGYAAPQMELKLNLEQLMGKFTRLRAELASAYSSPVGEASLTNRLRYEIAATQGDIAKAQPANQQSDDLLPAPFW